MAKAIQIGETFMQDEVVFRVEHGDSCMQCDLHKRGNCTAGPFAPRCYSSNVKVDRVFKRVDP